MTNTKPESSDESADHTFAQFSQKVQQLLEGTAKEKQYNQTGIDGPNELYEFVYNMTGGHGHAEGEVVYKMKRFAAKGNIEDVLKAAAWCFLIYKYHR